MSVSLHVSVPAVKYEQSKHIALIFFLISFNKKKIKKREKPLDSDIKPQEQKTRKKNFPSVTRPKAVIVLGL